MKTTLRILWSSTAFGVVLLLCGTSISTAQEDFSKHNVRQQKSNKVVISNSEELLFNS